MFVVCFLCDDERTLVKILLAYLAERTCTLRTVRVRFLSSPFEKLLPVARDEKISQDAKMKDFLYVRRFWYTKFSS